MDHVNQQNVPDYTEDEINLTDLVLVVLKRKKMIFLLVLFTILGSVVCSLLLPKVYTATARILPPQKSESSLAGLLSSGGPLEGLGVSLFGGKSSADLFIGILESRTVADILIKRFNLSEVYEQNLKEEVYRILAANTNIQISRKTQIISVSVDDRNPALAAELANAYVEALDHVNRVVNITEGKRKRVFLEARLEKVKNELVAAETALKDFQEKYKLVALDEQARVTIEGAAKLKGEIIAAQTELEVLKEFGTERQNEAIMLKSRITELENQLARIGKKDESKRNPDFYVPLNELPELGLQLARLTREAKIQEKVFELVTSQYELAKIEEAKDMDTIQVLDRAVPPERKSKPKRFLIVTLSTIVAVFVGFFIAFLLEYMSRLKTDDPERYQQLKDAMRLRRKKAGSKKPDVGDQKSDVRNGQ